MDNLEWMRQVIAEVSRIADKGYPYPGVAALLVYQNRRVTLQSNAEPGKPHAEIKAIEEAVKGEWPVAEMVLYTNLEPCTNVGLVLPCADACLKAGIKEVHISHHDPYHLVRGRGIVRLQEAGVKVILGEMEEEARWVNRRYFERFCPHCGWVIKD